MLQFKFVKCTIYMFNVLVCDAYIVQEPLITPIYINGLFQTHNIMYNSDC